MQVKCDDTVFNYSFKSAIQSAISVQQPMQNISN